MLIKVKMIKMIIDYVNKDKKTEDTIIFEKNISYYK